MAGILDKKTRFMDSFLTQTGREQLAKGELNFAFATFSDLATFYESSREDPNKASDAINRIFFEAANRPQDLVIPEFDADGGIVFPAGSFNIENGQLKRINATTGSILITGQEMAVSSSLAISDCVESFQDMRPLRTEEVSTDEAGFRLSQNEGEFLVTTNLPISPGAPKQISLSNIESLYQDKRLTHVPNYQFLPPINKTSRKQLRVYPRLQQPAPLTYSDLELELGANDPSGETGVGAPISLTFPATSAENNLVCQVWEVCSGSINKLRAIDFGEFEDSDPRSPGRHVFFVGKLFKDDADESTFLNLFTMVFD